MDAPPASRRGFEKQMMRYLFSTFMLWLISKGPIHGYEILKRIEGERGMRMLAPSQIYPVLKNLTRMGLVTAERKMHGRRVRKVYHITGKGKEALREARRCVFQSSLKRQFLREMVA
ncbi:MAG: PadR family transcriptional regulator [Candidatus Micrarchaeota archaeon]